MIITQLDNKRTLARWLLVASLLLSLFTFSGYVTKSQSPRQFTSTSFSVFHYNKEKHSILYQHQINFKPTEVPTNSFPHFNTIEFARCYTALIKTALHHNTRLIFSLRLRKLFLNKRTTPTTLTEDLLPYSA